MRRNLLISHWRPFLRTRTPQIARRINHTESSQASRVDRITSKLPRSLQKYTNGLRNAPVSHIVSFLILHEITAIVPVLGLFGLFHYTDYVPVNYVTGHFGSYVEEGVSRFERYFKRKQWFGFVPDDANKQATERTVDSKSEDALERWHSGDSKYKLVVEIALAYAITKALLPVRIMASVWATPWFASILMRIKQGVKP